MRWTSKMLFISIIMVVPLITLTAQAEKNPDRETTFNSSGKVEAPLITLAGREDKRSRSHSRKRKSIDSEIKATPKSSGKDNGFVKLPLKRMRQAPSHSKPINPDGSVPYWWNGKLQGDVVTDSKPANPVADPRGFKGNQLRAK